MPELDGQVALVTGGGRGIGANIARELAAAGARSPCRRARSDELEALALEIDRRTPWSRMSRRATPSSAMVRAVESGLGPIDLLAANAGINAAGGAGVGSGTGRLVARVRGQRARRLSVLPRRHPGMLERGRGRIVITGSGAAYLPGSANSAYSASKAAVWRLGEVLARQLEGRIPVFVDLPRPRPHADDDVGGRRRAVDAAEARAAARPCPRVGPRDALSGRYIHAEHDDIEDLIARADEIRENDLNAIRLQR